MKTILITKSDHYRQPSNNRLSEPTRSHASNWPSSQNKCPGQPEPAEV